MVAKVATLSRHDGAVEDDQKEAERHEDKCQKDQKIHSQDAMARCSRERSRTSRDMSQGSGERTQGSKEIGSFMAQ